MENKGESLLVKVTNLMKTLGETFYHSEELIVARIVGGIGISLIADLKREFPHTSNVYSFENNTITVIQVSAPANHFLTYLVSGRRVDLPIRSKYFIFTPEYIAIVLDEKTHGLIRMDLIKRLANDYSLKFNEDGYLVSATGTAFDNITKESEPTWRVAPFDAAPSDVVSTLTSGTISVNDMPTDFTITSGANGNVIAPDRKIIFTENISFSRGMPPEDLVTSLRARINQLEGELSEVRAAKPAAYLERNKLVAVLSTLFPSGIKKTAIEGWDEEWHNCVYIDLPNGQASWHYNDRDVELFAHLPPYEGEWDGHTTEEKYESIMTFVQCNGAPNVDHKWSARLCFLHDGEWVTGQFIGFAKPPVESLDSRKENIESSIPSDSSHSLDDKQITIKPPEPPKYTMNVKWTMPVSAAEAKLDERWRDHLRDFFDSTREAREAIWRKAMPRITYTNQVTGSIVASGTPAGLMEELKGLGEVTVDNGIFHFKSKTYHITIPINETRGITLDFPTNAIKWLKEDGEFVVVDDAAFWGEVNDRLKQMDEAKK